MSQTQIKDFTTGNITKQLLAFASPLLLSNLLQVAYNMVDMIIVGNTLGASGISAVAVGGDVSNFLTCVAMGFSSAGQVLIAQYIGAKKQDKIGRFVGTMSSFLALCAVVISVIGLFFRHSILQIMNTPQEAFDGALGYSSICMVGLVFIYGYNVVSAILRGMGDSKHPFLFISIAALLNLGLDLVFVIGMDMGAVGAALATVISQAVSFLSCTFFLYKRREAFALQMSRQDFLRWDLTMLSKLLRLGTPMAIKTASIHISKLFVNSWINSYGLAVSAFAGVANKVASMTNLISAAMNTASSTMVGQNIAAQEYKRVTSILKRVAMIMLPVSTLFAILVALFPMQFFGIFTKDTAVLEIAVKYVPIAILLFYGSAMRAIMNGLLNGSGNYKINFVTAILDGIVLRIGLSVLFGLVIGMKHYGFWLGDALAGFTPFWIGIVFYLTGKWKGKHAV